MGERTPCFAEINFPTLGWRDIGDYVHRLAVLLVREYVLLTHFVSFFLVQTDEESIAFNSCSNQHFAERQVNFGMQSSTSEHDLQ